MASHEAGKLPRVDVIGTAWTEADIDVDGAARVEIGHRLGMGRPRHQQAAKQAERNQASAVPSESHVALHGRRPCTPVATLPAKVASCPSAFGGIRIE